MQIRGKLSNKQNDKIKSELNQFGLVFGLFFLILHIILKRSDNLFIYMSALLLMVTLFFYKVLMPLNFLWLKLGEIFGRITTSLLLGFVFYAVLTPIALLKRFLGNKDMDIDFSFDKETYWIKRNNKQVSAKDFEQQF